MIWEDLVHNMAWILNYLSILETNGKPWRFCNALFLYLKTLDPHPTLAYVPFSIRARIFSWVRHLVLFFFTQHWARLLLLTFLEVGILLSMVKCCSFYFNGDLSSLWMAHEHATNKSTACGPADCTPTTAVMVPAFLAPLSNGSSVEQWIRALYITLICYPLSTWLCVAPGCFSSPSWDSHGYRESCLKFAIHPPTQCWSNRDTKDNTDECEEERMFLCWFFNRIEVPRQCEKYH